MPSGVKKIVRTIVPRRVIPVAETAYRKTRVAGVSARFGFPARGLKIIAVTGTNGKTTTCSYINEMLKHAGHLTAMFTTAEIELAGAREPNRTHRTVPLTTQLYRFFQQAKRAKVDYVVLEVTSQALDQHKLLGLPVEVAVLTNLSQDHLDYHQTMESYAEAKAQLFNGYISPKTSVLNRDDGWFDFFANQAVGQQLTYGRNKDSGVRIHDVGLSAGGSSFKLNYAGKVIKLKTALIGEFNVENATAAAAAGLALGLEPSLVAAGVGALAGVPGRMEPIKAGQAFEVLVDYAHTPDALENALQTLKSVAKGKVAVVFGATGDRDKAKRPQMGEVAARHADRIYLTDDETYTEDPEAIRNAVLEGIKKARGTKKTEVIADRRQAIKAAFAAAKRGDAVLLAGLGHQEYRAMGGRQEKWDEREIARKLLYQTNKA